MSSHLFEGHVFQHSIEDWLLTPSDDVPPLASAGTSPAGFESFKSIPPLQTPLESLLIPYVTTEPLEPKHQTTFLPPPYPFEDHDISFRDMYGPQHPQRQMHQPKIPLHFDLKPVAADAIDDSAWIRHLKRVNVNDITVIQLKELLRKLGCSATGKKHVLIERFKTARSHYLEMARCHSL